MAPRIANSDDVLRGQEPLPPSSPPPRDGLDPQTSQTLLAEFMQQTHAQMMGNMLGSHVGITCDSCKKSNFFGYRYKCSICDNYDLCANCFEERKETLDHEKQHPFILLKRGGKGRQYSRLHESGLEKLNRETWDKNVVHSFGCNPCGNMIPIKGLAIVCDDCKGGYRMCYSCYSSGSISEDHQGDHCTILKTTSKVYKIINYGIGLQDKLGSSAFGVVHKSSVNGKKRLVRVCKTRKDFVDSLSIQELQKLQDEMEIYNEFHCEFIVELKGYNFTGPTAFMTNEYFRNKSLGDHLRKESYSRINKAIRFQFCESLIRALFRMHKKGVIHGDMKPDKVLLTDFGTAKLGSKGFGFDPEEKRKSRKYAFGNSYYPQNDANKSAPSYDVYAYGLLFNEIITEIQNVSLTPDDCLDKSKVPYFGDMIAACINSDEQKRPSTQCIKKHLLAFREVMDERKVSNEVTTNNNDNVMTMNTIFDEAYESFATSTIFVVESDDRFEENGRICGFEKRMMKLLQMDEDIERGDRNDMPNCGIQ